MNRKELEELIDSEVDKVLSNTNMTEPQPELEPEQTQNVSAYVPPKRASMSEEELDEILFYGGHKPQDEKF